MGLNIGWWLYFGLHRFMVMLLWLTLVYIDLSYFYGHVFMVILVICAVLFFPLPYFPPLFTLLTVP